MDYEGGWVFIGKQSNKIHLPIKDVTEGNYKATDVEVIGSIHTVDEDVWHPYVYIYSSHRDDTIYKNERYWDSVFCIDVTNREETRDVVDSMLNFVFNRSRDDPIVVQQCPNIRCDRDLKLSKQGLETYLTQLCQCKGANGSIIEMTGPKRGIGMVADVIFEFDMRIKNGEKEEDDLQLIDEIIEIDDNVVTMIGTPRTFRLSGDCGPVDMSMAIFDNAVEATVEVAISELHYGFDLSISYVLSELEENREFQLFRGAIGESCGLRSCWAISLLGRDAKAVELRVDSKSALALAKNLIFHERSKHIHIKYHFIRSCLDEGSIKASYINTKDRLTDLLTKSLGRVKFQELCARIGMVQIPQKAPHKT
uniref:DUF6598 domain-containing protein n=1 Tax=Oryza sativa subsp. japonica TaxID=39947 RepID=Q2QVI9_ORYSJ|nr:hypothetical protein LOC_Os12g12650 [Oryza sativa Japonica Group]